MNYPQIKNVDESELHYWKLTCHGRHGRTAQCTNEQKARKINRSPIDEIYLRSHRKMLYVNARTNNVSFGIRSQFYKINYNEFCRARFRKCNRLIHGVSCLPYRHSSRLRHISCTARLKGIDCSDDNHALLRPMHIMYIYM